MNHLIKKFYLISVPFQILKDTKIPIYNFKNQKYCTSSAARGQSSQRPVKMYSAALTSCCVVYFTDFTKFTFIDNLILYWKVSPLLDGVCLYREFELFDLVPGIQMLSVQPDTKPKGCAGCNRKIKDRYLLKALDKYWHEDCLKCACCDCRLGEVGSTLYTKANLILCRRDYLR